MGKGIALVTGASRGIGAGIAVALARAGYDIAGLATHLDPANTKTGLYAVKREVEAAGASLLPLAGDIACLDDHERILRETLDAYGRVDVLVNNAGVAPLERKSLLEGSPGSFDRLVNINLRGPYFSPAWPANDPPDGRRRRSARHHFRYQHQLVSPASTAPNTVSKAGSA